MMKYKEMVFSNVGRKTDEDFAQGLAGSREESLF